jgi:microcystin degradation protein MlrC
MLRGEIQPTVAWRKIPMLTPQDQFLTSQGPMKTWFARARQFERQPGVIDVSPYPMQPWLDAAEGGSSVVVHTNDNPALADAIADEMADAAWSMREQFWGSERVAPAEAVRQADAADQGLTILSDTGDSVYGGAPGDSTCILKALLERRSFAINHPVLYSHLGVNVAAAKMVVVKTASNFQFFAPWRRGLIRVDSPGTTQSDLTAFAWKRVPRPIYPLDALTVWRLERS